MASLNESGSAGVLGRLLTFFRNQRGNMGAIAAILLVPLIGAMAMGVEISNWHLVQRAAQNAADTAAITAATEDAEDGGTGGSDYVTAAQSVATSNYNFTTGTSTTVAVGCVSPSKNSCTQVTSKNSGSYPAACATTTCYSVQITTLVPIHLTSIVGYKGDATSCFSKFGGNGQCIAAIAYADTRTVLAPFCLVTTSGGITAHGVPMSNMTCNIFANGNADCTGHSLTAGFSDSTTSSNSCGSAQFDNQAAPSDPYAADASNIPPNPCSSYYPDSNANWASHGGISLSGTVSWSQQTSCGDVKLTGNVTVNSAAAVLVIENGTLDTNGYTIQTASGAGMTIIFNGPSGNTYTSGGTPADFITGGGGVDTAAPTSGNWSGIAIYQNSNVTTQSITYTGNSPTLGITGVIYAPEENLTAKGAVNKSSNGLSCFTLIVASLDIRGTGDLFNFPNGAQSQCQQAGVTQDSQTIQIGQLVY